MRCYTLSALALATSIVHANIVTEISDAYDFVIVGGGLAGLALGGRLSETKDFSVLVLEAGNNGDDYREQIDVPGNAYYQSLWNTPCDWGFQTVPQVHADNIQMEWPRGKVLGGSSAINGLYLVRPGETEINAWKDLLGDMEGAQNWSWDAMYAAMKKSEHFTPPEADVAKMGDITWDSASHGTSGPIHMSWPGYTFPMVGDWSKSAQNAGVDITKNPYDGQNPGAYVAMSAINPTNWTRSYSRTGYLDPLPPRKNYDVLANAQVTRLLFDPSSPTGNLSAKAVEYTPDGGSTMLNVTVKKEVILAGGTVGSPTVLLYSGVGPKDTLDAAGVDVLVNLPGVGENLQDHVSVQTVWNTTQPTAGTIFESNGTETTNPKFLSYINDAIAYINSSVLFGSDVSAMQKSFMAEGDALIPADESLAAGYRSVIKATVDTIFPSTQGQIELLIGNTNTENQVIDLGASLQHPLSHGRIYINSSDPMNYPVIDPNYLSNPADIKILTEGLKTARRIAQAEPLSSMMTEFYPGPSVQSDEEWDSFIRQNIFTEYHPCGTCAMLPRNQGGVVDANLQVYGLANVRVVDASITPFDFSAHLMSSTYGIAEQAAVIITDHYAGKGDSNVGSIQLSGSHGHGSQTHKNSQHSGAAQSAASLGLVLSSLFAVATCVMFGL